MEIKLTRVYTLKSDLTAAQFIQQVDQTMEIYDSRLDSLDMGDAVSAAVDLHEQGDFQPSGIEIDWDQEYDYVDCPDKSTQLNKDDEDGVYSIVPGTNDPNFETPHAEARRIILQGRFVRLCSACQNHFLCHDEGSYLSWVCPTWLDKMMAIHFSGEKLSIPDIDNYPTPLVLEGWTTT